MHAHHDDASTAFLDELDGWTSVLPALSEDQLLAPSRCRGWALLDVATHVHLGLQEMFGGLVSPSRGAGHGRRRELLAGGAGGQRSRSRPARPPEVRPTARFCLPAPIRPGRPVRPHRGGPGPGGSRASAGSTAVPGPRTRLRRFPGDLGCRTRRSPPRSRPRCASCPARPRPRSRLPAAPPKPWPAERCRLSGTMPTRCCAAGVAWAWMRSSVRRRAAWPRGCRRWAEGGSPCPQ